MLGLLVIVILLTSLSVIKKRVANKSVVNENNDITFVEDDNKIGDDDTDIEDDAIIIEQDYADCIPVLCYHHIIPGELPEMATTKAVVPLREFEEQMKYLHENEYKTLKLKDLENFIYEKQNLPEKSVLITFDDGYESNYVYALPIMQKYDLNFVIFLIGNEVKEENEEPWNPEKLSNLTAKQIKKIAATGLVEFGNHTYDLHRYIKERPAIFSKPKKEISSDFEVMSELFNTLGLPVSSAISYPFGVYNETLLKQAQNHGYKLGFTIQEGRVDQGSHPYKLNRLVVPHGITLEEFRGILETM